MFYAYLFLVLNQNLKMLDFCLNNYALVLDLLPKNEILSL